MNNTEKYAGLQNVLDEIERTIRMAGGFEGLMDGRGRCCGWCDYTHEKAGAGSGHSCCTRYTFLNILNKKFCCLSRCILPYEKTQRSKCCERLNYHMTTTRNSSNAANAQTHANGRPIGRSTFGRLSEPMHANASSGSFFNVIMSLS